MGSALSIMSKGSGGGPGIGKSTAGILANAGGDG